MLSHLTHKGCLAQMNTEYSDQLGNSSFLVRPECLLNPNAILAFLSAIGLKVPVLIQGRLKAAKERVGLQLSYSVPPQNTTGLRNSVALWPHQARMFAFYGVLAFLSAVGLKVPVLIQGRLEEAKERVGLQH